MITARIDTPWGVNAEGSYGPELSFDPTLGPKVKQWVDVTGQEEHQHPSMTEPGKGGNYPVASGQPKSGNPDLLTIEVRVDTQQDLIDIQADGRFWVYFDEDPEADPAEQPRSSTWGFTLAATDPPINFAHYEQGRNALRISKTSLNRDASRLFDGIDNTWRIDVNRVATWNVTAVAAEDPDFVTVGVTLLNAVPAEHRQVLVFWPGGATSTVLRQRQEVPETQEFTDLQSHLLGLGATQAFVDAYVGDDINFRRDVFDLSVREGLVTDQDNAGVLSMSQIHHYLVAKGEEFDSEPGNMTVVRPNGDRFLLELSKLLQCDFSSLPTPLANRVRAAMQEQGYCT